MDNLTMFDNLRQNLLEKIGEWLDSQPVVTEEILAGIHGNPNEDDELHIKMAYAAMNVYAESRKLHGGKFGLEEGYCILQSQAKYLILCANCAHPSGEMKFFLLVDDDENTVEFETEEAAKIWCADAGSDGPFAYIILCTEHFSYE